MTTNSKHLHRLAGSPVEPEIDTLGDGLYKMSTNIILVDTLILKILPRAVVITA